MADPPDMSGLEAWLPLLVGVGIVVLAACGMFLVAWAIGNALGWYLYGRREP